MKHNKWAVFKWDADGSYAGTTLTDSLGLYMTAYAYVGDELCEKTYDYVNFEEFTKDAGYVIAQEIACKKINPQDL